MKFHKSEYQKMLKSVEQCPPHPVSLFVSGGAPAVDQALPAGIVTIPKR
jgi:hypothetical protein